VVNVSVHVQRVVLHQGVEVSREALEAAIAGALRERLGVDSPAPPVRDPGVDVQVGRAVAPAVLGGAP
jgi:hypothetical protein